MLIPYKRQSVSVFSADGDRWKTQRHLRRKTVRGKFTRQRAKSESCKEKTQMLKSIYRTLLWRSTLQNDRYSVRSIFQNGLFCLFLPFVRKGAKKKQKHERSNVTAVKALWMLTVSLFHLSGKDRSRQRKYQRGHFPRWEVFKRKVCSVATKREVRLDRHIFVTTILCSARHSSLFS